MIVRKRFNNKNLFSNFFRLVLFAAAIGPVEHPDTLPKTPTVPGKLAILVTERWT